MDTWSSKSQTNQDPVVCRDLSKWQGFVAQCKQLADAFNTATAKHKQHHDTPILLLFFVNRALPWGVVLSISFWVRLCVIYPLCTKTRLITLHSLCLTQDLGGLGRKLTVGTPMKLVLICCFPGFRGALSRPLCCSVTVLLSGLVAKSSKMAHASETPVKNVCQLKSVPPAE